MSSSFTDYLQVALLNHIFRHVAYTSPTTVYVGLFTSATTNTGGGTEVSGGSYARQAAAFSAPSSNIIINSGAIAFPTATADWGKVLFVALFDASTSGNMLVQGEVIERTINTGDTWSVRAGDLRISFGAVA